jgi:hypothetical protein
MASSISGKMESDVGNDNDQQGTANVPPNPPGKKMASARAMLIQMKMLEGDRTDLSVLTLALGRIAEQVGRTKGLKTASKVIRAVAMLIEDASVNVIVDKITKGVLTQGSPFTKHWAALCTWFLT